MLVDLGLNPFSDPVSEGLTVIGHVDYNGISIDAHQG
jgi:hypothetical protein